MGCRCLWGSFQPWVSSVQKRGDSWGANGVKNAWGGRGRTGGEKTRGGEKTEGLSEAKLG